MVGDLCVRRVILAQRSETIVEAARRMRDFHVGDLVVVDNLEERKPIGILTDRDIVVAGVAEMPERLNAALVGDLMSLTPQVVREEESLQTALATMREHGVRRLPVVDRQGTMEGILTLDDVVEHLAGLLSDVGHVVVREQKHERVARPSS